MKNDYVWSWVPNRGKLKQHRLIMEEHLGRRLKTKEQVHHINHVRNDNRIENLQFCKDAAEHRKFDEGWWLEEGNWWKVCKGCKRSLKVNTDNFYSLLRRNGIRKYDGRCKKCTCLQDKKERALKRH